VLAALPPALRRRLAVAAAADYWFRWPLLGALARLLVNAFPMARRGCARGGLERCRALAAESWALLVYPEGTRSPDGALQPFKPGVGLLAVELGLPVVPVALAGTHACLPRGARWPRRGPAAVAFGPPLRFEHGVTREVAAFRIAAAVGVLHCYTISGLGDGSPARSSAPHWRGVEERDGDDDGDHGAVQRGRHPAQPAVQDPAARPLRL
jgi:long-chain acyl-CoA synthetase